MARTKAKKSRASEDSQFNRMMKLTIYIAKNGSQAQKDRLERLLKNTVMERTGVQA